ncbi:cyclic-di-AMP receptor [Shouchella sp. JSM 1781072]|uniref:cyclic-di-AMP receptor n=1 Tax=Bacillaceae TaxID=186817 RepID=UPI000C06D094|nr:MULTISPECIES: cyclic-di-AMP receptor [Bacillaceae]UTR07702.1 cyclic-di-AMP receptor [Alkalihalobacillus sp. LMS6]
MKLLVCIIEDFYADHVERELRDQGYRMTELSSSGGFLKKGSTTFLFGVHETDVEQLQQSLKDACLEVEKRKQRKDKKTHRFTSFLLPAANATPLLLQDQL